MRQKTESYDHQKPPIDDVDRVLTRLHEYSQGAFNCFLLQRFVLLFVYACQIGGQLTAQLGLLSLVLDVSPGTVNLLGRVLYFHISWASVSHQVFHLKKEFTVHNTVDYCIPTNTSGLQVTMPSDATPLGGQSSIETLTRSAEDPGHRVKGNDEEYSGSPHDARPPSILVSWWLEGLAIIISLLLLAAIVGVLYRFDGKEQPDWPYWINLNTVVATMSTILRAQLLLVAAEGQFPTLSSPSLGL